MSKRCSFIVFPLLRARLQLLLQPCPSARPGRGGGKRNRCGFGAGAQAKRGATAVSILLAGREGQRPSPSPVCGRQAAKRRRQGWKPKAETARGFGSRQPGRASAGRQAHMNKGNVWCYLLSCSNLRDYLANDGGSPFEEWFTGIDAPAAAKVAVALARLEHGNLSNAKGVGEGALEYRIDWGPGYLQKQAGIELHVTPQPR